MTRTDQSKSATQATSIQFAASQLAIDQDDASRAADFLKVFAHRDRLAILCALIKGEQTVSAIEEALSLRQAAVSQHLTRLRLEGFVAARRDGKKIHYSISDPRTVQLIGLLHDLFCAPAATR